MSLASRFRYIKNAYFSQTTHDRMLHRAMKRERWTNILQIGIGDAERTLKLIETGLLDGPLPDLRFTGIDLFETSAGDAPSLSLKAAHQLFRSRGIRVQLIPGDANSALARTANAMSGIDLVLISAGQKDESLTRAWFYLPRVISPNCHIYREETVDSELIWRQIESAELQQLAGTWKRRRAA